MSAVAKLMRIQTKIKAPKNLYNSFGKYNYRNAEAICEAVKPFLAEENCAMMISDSIIEVGGRIYVKASAELIDCDTGACIGQAEAFAREAESKKGMDESQVTGTASSYARKYALNGLFLLDDTKDADSDEYKAQTEGKKSDAKTEEAKEEAKANEIGKQKISEVKVKSLESRCESDGVPVEKVLNLYKIKSLADMTENQFANIHANWEKIKAI